MAEFVWTPTPEQVEQANVTRLIRRLGCADYHELQRLSVEDPERFWPEVVDDLGIEFSREWERVLDTSRGIEWTTWFLGGKMNLVHNCVDKWVRDSPDAVALISRVRGRRGAHLHLRGAWTVRFAG